MKNTVSTHKRDGNPTGPVMGMYAGTGSGGNKLTAAWFQDCRFAYNDAAVPSPVAVQNSTCRVYSNTDVPGVWDIELGRELAPWQLRTSGSNDAFPGGQRLDVFAAVDSNGRGFLRLDDAAFQSIMWQQVFLTGLEKIEIVPLPRGTQFVTTDPYTIPVNRTEEVIATPTSSTADSWFWTKKAILLPTGLGSGVMLCVLVAYMFLPKRLTDHCFPGGVPNVQPPASHDTPSSQALVHLTEQTSADADCTVTSRTSAGEGMARPAPPQQIQPLCSCEDTIGGGTKTSWNDFER